MVDKNREDSGAEVINLSSQRMSVSETKRAFLEDQDNSVHCEIKALWRSVITQALMDAGSNSKKPEFRKEKARAISWLNGESEDFNEVCVMADMCPSYVREKAKEAIKRGCTWRKAPNPFKKSKKVKKENAYAKELDEPKLMSSKMISSDTPLVFKSL